MKISFPVYICAKDSGEVFSANSIYELQRSFEEIDIENGEYLAWDGAGNPLKLGLQEPIWLTVEPDHPSGHSQLIECFQNYLNQIGSGIRIPGPSPTDFAKAYEELAAFRSQKAIFSKLFRGKH